MLWKLITGMALIERGFLAPDDGAPTGGGSATEEAEGDDDFLNIDGAKDQKDEPTGLMATREAEKKKGKKEKGSEEKKDGKTSARPEWLEEKYWDKDKNEPRIEALAKSNTDLFSQLQRFRGQKGIPETPEAYVEGMFDKKGNLQLPEGVKGLAPITKDDPVFQGFLKVAHKHGLSNEQFNGVVKDFMQVAASSMPEPFDNEAYVSEQKQILGPNADALIDHSSAWIKSLVVQGHLSADQGKALYDGVGASAHGVLAIQKLYRMATGELGIPTDTPLPEQGIPTQQEWYDMKLSEKYRTDPEFKHKVDGLAEAVFPGTGQADFSKLGMGRIAQRDGEIRLRKKQEAMRPKR